VLAVNTFGAQGLLSRHVTSTNASTFYAFDERGNVAQRTSIAGAILSSDLYDAYGKLLAGGASGAPWGFEAQAGYYTDSETGLVLCTHRYYDTNVGRFLTRDPLGSGRGINLYSYTANDPVNEEDPDGLDYFGDVAQVFAGYGDLINPVNIYNGVVTISRLAGSDGFGAAGSALGQGIWHGLTDWTSTSDPRHFGQSFGTALLAVTPGLRRLPNLTPIKLYDPFPSGGGWTLLRVDDIRRVGSGGQPEPQVCRIDFDRLPSVGKGATNIPPNLRGRFLPHYHNRGPGGIARHRPWEGGNGRRW
jgi:RHS repeat-associated protein